ncbi:hypothetical protein FZC71_00925 [Bacillus subtilis]|nr:hypothetical protein FZC71_00925 [Bacillus subtilis]
MKIDLNAMGYDELISHGEEVMRAIRLRAYGEGYRQGKFDADMDAEHVQKPNKDVVFMTATPEKLAQVLRDEIVEQAKADVETLSNYGDGVRYETDVFTKATCNVEFVSNRDKRTVVALLKGVRTGNVYAKGIAKAAPSDCFNVHIGKAIALRRALGLAVPDEYLNAPQPTEVRVGDVIVYRGALGPIKTATVVPNSASVWKSNNKAALNSYAVDHVVRIIDDSREEVGE